MQAPVLAEVSEQTRFFRHFLGDEALACGVQWLVSHVRGAEGPLGAQALGFFFFALYEGLGFGIWDVAEDRHVGVVVL
jgi:hypothetical protein